MESRRIIEGAAFGPDVLRVIRSAFDEAWLELEAMCPEDVRDEVRKRLAKGVMSAAREDSADIRLLRDAGIRAMERGYPEHFMRPPVGGSLKVKG